MTTNASNPQEDCGHGGSGDEWSDGQRGLTGGPAAGQAAFDVPHSEHEPTVESERNPGGLLADKRDVSGSGEHEQATLCDLSASEQRADEQRGLDRFAVDFDDYGPTMDQPVPSDEYRTLPGSDGIEYRELPGTGVAPSDFGLLDAWANQRGFHPDDQWRERSHKLHGEAMARAYALEQAARPRMSRRGDR